MKLIKKYRYILILLAVLGAGAAWYGYREFTRTHVSLKEMKAEMSVSAAEIMRAFSEDENKAGEIFVGKEKEKVIEVMGRVTGMDTTENGAVHVYLGVEGEMNSVSCEMDSLHRSEVKNLSIGNEAVIRGVCTGYLMDVVLVRCVVGEKLN